MQGISISHWVSRNSQNLFVASCILMLTALIIGLLSDYFWIALLPVIAACGVLFIMKPSWLFFTLLAVLPISMEYEIGSFGTDLPSEPIAIAMAGLTFIWLLTLNIHQSKEIFRHPFVLVLLIHVVWVMLCLPFSGIPMVSFKYLLSKIWYILGFFLASYWILNRFKTARNALIVLAFISTATVVFVMIEHYPLDFTFESINAACNPLYRNHVTYGVFIVMILPILLFIRSISNPDRISRLFINAGVIILLAGIYLSYTRGAWLAIPVMATVWLMIKWQWVRYLFPLSFLAAILFFVIVAKDYKYLEFAPNYEETIYHEELSDHLNATFEGKDMSTMERFHRWIAAFRLSAEHPVFGVGPNNFVDFYKPYTVSDFETYISDNDERSTVHNYFILMLAEQGYPGMIIALMIVGVFFIHGERTYQRLKTAHYRKMYMACLLCGTAFWLNNLFSDLLEANKLAPLFFIAMALMMRIEEWDKEKSVETVKETSLPTH
jgi:O-antigen ligase